MCACPVPAETRERAGLVFGQVPADLHVPRVAGLLRRRLGDHGAGRGVGSRAWLCAADRAAGGRCAPAAPCSVWCTSFAASSR